MYARSACGVRSVLTLELPILPFLAPRVFQPWPKKTRGRRSAATAVVQEENGQSDLLGRQIAFPGQLGRDGRAPNCSDQLRTEPIDFHVKGEHGMGQQACAVRNRQQDGTETTYTSDDTKYQMETQSESITPSSTHQPIRDKIRSKEVAELGRIVHLLNQAGDIEAAAELQSIIGKDGDPEQQASHASEAEGHGRNFKEVYNTIWDTSETNTNRLSRVGSVTTSRPYFEASGSDAVHLVDDTNRQAQSSQALGSVTPKLQYSGGLTRREKRLQFLANSHSSCRQMKPAWKPLVPSKHTFEALISSLWATEIAQRSSIDCEQSHMTIANAQRTGAERRLLNETRSWARFLARLNSSTAIRALWKKQCSSAQSQDHKSSTNHHVAWLSVMLHVLKYDIDSAFKVFVATSDTPGIPASALSDALELIIRHHARLDSDNAYKALKIVREELTGMFESGECRPTLRQTSIYCLLKHCRHNEVKSFLDILLKHDIFLHPNTLLHFITALTRAGDTKSALHALSVLHDHGADFANPAVESVCATLLRSKAGEWQSKASDLEIFETMLKFGLKPNIIFYNILLHNACENESSGTAWQIYAIMDDVGIKADEYTMSILLKDAKDRLDEEAVRNVELIMRKRGISNAYLVTDLMHAKFLFGEEYRQDPPGQTTVLPEIYALYSKHWSPEPLTKLFPERTIGHARTNAGSASDVPLPLSPLPALAVMVGAMIHHFRSAEEASSFYHRVLKLVSHGDELILPLAGTASFWDAIIKALGRSTKNLHLCTQVLEAMLSATHANPFPLNNSVRSPNNVTEPFTVSNSLPTIPTRSKLSYKMPKPTIRTWTILLKAYIDHNQPRAAEKVLSLLKARGLQPNQITWNTLATGYARLQDVPNTVNTIKRLEQAGCELDAVGLRGLQCIQDRQALMKAMAAKRQSESEREVESEGAGLVDPLPLPEDENEHLRGNGKGDEDVTTGNVTGTDVYGSEDSKQTLPKTSGGSKNSAWYPMVRRVPELARRARRRRPAALDPATLVMT